MASAPYGIILTAERTYQLLNFRWSAIWGARTAAGCKRSDHPAHHIAKRSAIGPGAGSDHRASRGRFAIKLGFAQRRIGEHGQVIATTSMALSPKQEISNRLTMRRERPWVFGARPRTMGPCTRRSAVVPHLLACRRRWQKSHLPHVKVSRWPNAAPQITSITPNLASALALRKMLIEESGNDGFVNVAGRKMSPSESHCAARATLRCRFWERRNGVVAVSQILCTRQGEAREALASQSVRVFEMRLMLYMAIS